MKEINKSKKNALLVGLSAKLKIGDSLTKKYKDYDTLFIQDDLSEQSIINSDIRKIYRNSLKTFLFFRRNFRALSKFNVVWMGGEKRKSRKTNRSKDTTLETIDITNFAIYKKYMDAEKEIAAISGIDRFLNGFSRVNKS
ncbi:hypothetical protein EOM09_06985, partial [bacterium]|nr:hypothetical protein [bacterium]